MIYLIQLCNNPTNIELHQVPKKSFSLVSVWTVWHCQDPTQFKEGQWKWYENGGSSSQSQTDLTWTMKSTKKTQCSALGHVWSACQPEGQPNTHHCLDRHRLCRSPYQLATAWTDIVCEVTLPTHHCLDRHCLCRSPHQLTTAWTDTVCAGHPTNSPLPGPTLSVQVTLPTHHCLDPLCAGHLCMYTA